MYFKKNINDVNNNNGIYCWVMLRMCRIYIDGFIYGILIIFRVVFLGQYYCLFIDGVGGWVLKCKVILFQNILYLKLCWDLNRGLFGNEDIYIIFKF